MFSAIKNIALELSEKVSHVGQAFPKGSLHTHCQHCRARWKPPKPLDSIANEYEFFGGRPEWNIFHERRKSGNHSDVSVIKTKSHCMWNIKCNQINAETKWQDCHRQISNNEYSLNIHPSTNPPIYKICPSIKSMENTEYQPLQRRNGGGGIIETQFLSVISFPRIFVLFLKHGMKPFSDKKKFDYKNTFDKSWLHKMGRCQTRKKEKTLMNDGVWK